MAEKLFDLSEKYEEMLRQGVRLSGEAPGFFRRLRLDALAARLPAGWLPRRILDFGCGIGETTADLARRYPSAAVIGLDTAANALRRARESFDLPNVRFDGLDRLEAEPP